MSEPNPQEGIAPGDPPPRPPQAAVPTPHAPSAGDAPAGGINLTAVIIGVAVLLVGALVIMVAMSGSGGDGAPGDAVTTKSGLKYVDLKVGSGQEAKAGDMVKVHYTGTLKNGKKFDSSHDRNKPFDFSLGAGMVIKGWDEGVAGMKEGGKRKLFIPSDLAYGPEGKPPTIPRSADLVFEVELLKVN